MMMTTMVMVVVVIMMMKRFGNLRNYFFGKTILNFFNFKKLIGR